MKSFENVPTPFIKSCAVLILIFSCISSKSLAGNYSFEVGVGEASISPCDLAISPLYTTGGNAALISSCEDTLKVRALLIKDLADTKVLFITLDVIGITEELGNAIRAAVRHIAPEPNVVINCSHTHNSPTMVPFDFDFCSPCSAPASPMRGTPELVNNQPIYDLASSRTYRDIVVTKAAQAAQDAINSLTEAELYFGSGVSSISEYRRNDELYKHSSSTWLDKPGIGSPQRLDVLVAKTPADWPIEPETIAIAFFFGCHPTTKYSSAGVVSADYPGEAIRLIEQSNVGVKAFFFQGFGGDRQPIHLFSGTKTKADIGLELKNDVMDVVNTTAASPTRTGLRPINGYWTVDNYFNHLPLTQNSAPSGVLPTRVQVLKLISNGAAEWTLVANSHEVVSQYETLVREEWGNPSNVTVVGYSGFSRSYVPTRYMQIHDAGLQYRCLLRPLCDSGYEGDYSFKVYNFGSQRPWWNDSDFTSALSDSFYDGWPDPKWFVGTWSTYRWPWNPSVEESLFESTIIPFEANGKLSIQPLQNQPGLNYSGYVSQEFYDFTGKQLSAQLFSIPNTATTAEMLVGLGVNGDNMYRFSVQGGTLYAHARVSGTTYAQSLTAVTAGTYVRIRHESDLDVIVWEVSGNGIEWQEKHRRNRDFDIEAVRVEVIAGTYSAVNTPGVASFDNVELSKAKWKKGMFSTYGKTFDESVTNRLRTGGVTILPKNASVGYSGAVTTCEYNLVASSATVEVIQPPLNSGTVEMAFSVSAGANKFRFLLRGGYLHADVTLGNATTTRYSRSFNSSADRFFRFRHKESSNELYLETGPSVSSGYQSWSTLLVIPATEFSNLTGVRFELFAGTYEAQSTNGQNPAFDNFMFSSP